MFGCTSRSHPLTDVPGKMPETTRKMRALPWPLRHRPFLRERQTVFRHPEVSWKNRPAARFFGLEATETMPSKRPAAITRPSATPKITGLPNY